MTKKSDRALGMGSSITRRNFINGIAVATAWSALPGSILSAGLADDYPPLRTGMRGNHPGSYDAAHALVWQGKTDWGNPRNAGPDSYDLIIVGAGLSGLSAAHFYRKKNRAARILILDNHDDFGGHAKRNEFSYKGETIISYGGSQTLEGPGHYSQVSKQLLRNIGVDTGRFDKAYDQNFYRRNGLTGSTFFNEEKYGIDKLVPYSLMDYERFVPLDIGSITAEQAVQQMPIGANARRELLHLLELRDNVLGHMPMKEQRKYLRFTSYKDFLTNNIGITEPEVFALFEKMTADSGASIEIASAGGVMGYVGLPGYRATAFHKNHASLEPYICHFPDGNAGVARLLVRRLIPQVAPGSTMDDVVLAKFDYSKLDQAGAEVRLRLNSTAIHIEHDGKTNNSNPVKVIYVRDGVTYHVSAKNCVFAGYNAILPHLCPALPAAQKEALAKAIKSPILYTSVLLKNWRAWKKLEIGLFSAPGNYYCVSYLDFPVSMGGYEFSADPDQPIVVHMERFPTGDDAHATRREQRLAGRRELYASSFEFIERETRKQLAGALAGGGFDPAEDIVAITANRWGHGYAYGNDPRFDARVNGQYPNEIGRQRFGRLVIANSDAGASASVNAAFNEAYRAVEEL
jgi:spermidine dehydrogenase